MRDVTKKDAMRLKPIKPTNLPSFDEMGQTGAVSVRLVIDANRSGKVCGRV